LTSTDGKLDRLLYRLVRGETSPQAFVKALDELDPDPADALAEQLTQAEPEQKADIIQGLRCLEDRRILLPVMRFIFDTSPERDHGDARALGMRLLVEKADHGNRDQLFEFAKDLKEDPDPFVSANAFRLMVQTRPSEALAILVNHYHNEEWPVFVKETLEELIRSFDTSPIPGIEQLERHRLVELIAENQNLLEDNDLERISNREDTAEVAMQLFEHEPQTIDLVYQLSEFLCAPDRRELSKALMGRTNSDSNRAMALEILAEGLQGDASPDEQKRIEHSMQTRDEYLRLSAIRCATRSGVPELVRAVLDLIRSTGLPLAKTVAKRLAADAEYLPPETLETMQKVQQYVRKKRSRDQHKDWISAESHLNQALARLVHAESKQLKSIETECLDTLGRQTQHPEIIESSLKLLRAIERLSARDVQDRWHPFYGKTVVELIEKAPSEAIEPIMELLMNRAPPETPGLLEVLENYLPKLEPELFSRSKSLLARLPAEKAEAVLETVEAKGKSDILSDRAARLLKEIN
jgi:hypothetical protein